MKGVVTAIKYVGGVTAITINHLPAEIDVIAGIFHQIANKGISVDMISQTVPKGKSINISFTIDDNELSKVLGVLGAYKKDHPDIISDVSTGNAKFSFCGETMADIPGVGAVVLSILKEEGIDIKMITTSESDISLLVDEVNAQRCIDAAEAFYSLALS
jgi:aspartokinase